jgi:hypothetical protein
MLIFMTGEMTAVKTAPIAQLGNPSIGGMVNDPAKKLSCDLRCVAEASTLGRRQGIAWTTTKSWCGAFKYFSFNTIKKDM